MLPGAAAPFDYNTLPTSLQSDLRAEAASIRAQTKTTVLTIIQSGHALIKVKGKLLHGQFSAWVESECGFSLRTAENYIKAAEFAEGKTQYIALLPPASVYRLAAKSTPPEIVQEVIERIESGGRVSAKQIAEAFKDAAHQKRDAERRARDAERFRKKSKIELARQEALRRTEEKRKQEEEEKLRREAVSLIDAIGEDHARLVVKAIFAPQGWDIFEHMRREVTERETAKVKSKEQSNGSAKLKDEGTRSIGRADVVGRPQNTSPALRSRHARQSVNFATALARPEALMPCGSRVPGGSFRRITPSSLASCRSASVTS